MTRGRHRGARGTMVLHTLGLPRSSFGRRTVWAWRRLPPRTRRGVLLSLLYGIVAIPGFLSSVTVATLHYGTSRNASRGSQLSFPGLNSAGTIRTADVWDLLRWDYRTNGRPANAWDTLGPARGQVRLLPREQVWLELSPMAVSHPESLSKLSPGAVFRLSTVPMSGPMPPELANQIKRLTGLRELDLRYLPPPSGAWDWHIAFPKLECAWLPSPGDARDREQLVSWCARGGLNLAESGAPPGVLCFQRGELSLRGNYLRGAMTIAPVVNDSEGGMRHGEEKKGSRGTGAGRAERGF